MTFVAQSKLRDEVACELADSDGDLSDGRSVEDPRVRAVSGVALSYRHPDEVAFKTDACPSDGVL